MEKSIILQMMQEAQNENLITCQTRYFDLEEKDPSQVSPLTLAYLGDAVYELMIRTLLVEESSAKAGALHQQAVRLVKAEKQSELVGILEEHFTEEEERVYKRGRNAKSPTSAKNADIVDYRRATGLEAVFGYLYLKQDTERLCQLLKLGLDL